MLITFKSKAAPEIVMYKEHAQRILELFDKNVDQGILTPNETEGAIKLLESAIAESRAHPHSEVIEHDIETHHGDEGNDNDHEKVEPVTFSARAYPLLEMLLAAHAMQREVVWGI